MKNDVKASGVDGGFWNSVGIFIGRLRIAFRGLWKNPLLFVIMLLVALIPVRRAVIAEPLESLRAE